MRILHFADVHLDRPFVSLPRDAAARRRDDLFRAFQRCLSLAQDRSVDLITVGGDLWEEEHVRADTRNSVAYELGKLETPVLIACGNHDRLLAGGSYRRTEWPENVTIVDLRSLKEYRYGDLSVWSVSWGREDLSSTLLKTLEVPRDSRTHVLLLHGTSSTAPLSGMDSEGYLSFDPKLVRQAGLSLCLAGHIHIASCVDDVVYPGSPEPLGWAETGRHCAALIEFVGSRPKVELIDVHEKHYETRDVDCFGCGSSAELEDRVKRVLTDPKPQNVFLRLRLLGEVDPDCDIERSKVGAAQRARYAALVVVDKTEPVLDIDRRADRKGLDGLFVRKMRERLEAASGEHERRRLELAIQAGLRAIDGRAGVLRVD